MFCKWIWIEVSAKCINVNVTVYYTIKGITFFFSNTRYFRFLSFTSIMFNKLTW